VDQPPFDEVLAIHNGMKGSELGQAQLKLFERYGLENLVPTLAVAYPKVRHSEGRVAILFWLPRFARQRSDVVALACLALRDRAYLARNNACGILAYSLREDVIGELEVLLTHPHSETRADAAAAIDAIRSKNHHYFVDRKHTGSTFWGVNPGDVPGDRVSPATALG